MPAIKKRITAEYLAEQKGSEENGNADVNADLDAGDVLASTKVAAPASVKKKKEKSGGELNKLDGEILLEKRKRTIPPDELKLAAWLDMNFEKKPEVSLSSKQLYAFYTDMCQQDGGGVVEINLFNRMLREKLGKEFGLKEDSVYKGLLKEGKKIKKPTAKAHTLGLKLKDIIEEALKASGNPTKGVRFAWIKKYIATKYPAFQIELKPSLLRAALERGVGYKKLELVKGIGFCGFYRLPGPSEIDEEPSKEKKKKSEGEKEGDLGMKDEDTGDVENGDKAEEKEGIDEVKKKVVEGDDAEKSTEEKVEDDAEKTEKKRKQKAKPKKKLDYKGIDHSNPQRIEEVFPLALTYQSDPKEASFSKIKKYIEKYYRKTDIEEKLRRALEHGCESGKWDRVSGSGKSGSFQLLVDSFNPEETESMTDMVCSAIIACSEPKVASYLMIRKYISEYHPDFNIDAKPHKLKKAIERAIENKTLIQVSGLGMTGSFQLGEPFTPSPAILAWADEEDYSSDDDDEDARDVYVVRKTKSGRRAPVKRLEYRSEKKRGRPSASSFRGAKKSGAKAGRKPARKYADSDSEIEIDTGGSDAEEYTPRKTKSGRGRGPPAKVASRGGAAKPKGSASKSTGRSRPPKVATQSNKRGRPTSSKQQIKHEIESDENVDDEDEYVAQPTKSGRQTSKSQGKKSPAAKTGKGMPQSGRVTTGKTQKSYADDDEENYYEIEEEGPSPAKKAKKAEGKSAISKTPEKRKSGGGRAKWASEDDVTESTGRPARSASQSARKSMQESSVRDSDEEESEYVARPTASGRHAKKH